LNETLRRALLMARLTEEDVAARLEVDPKTVRRWLEGRVPYLRHRWVLAGMLDLDEADLWPEVSVARSRPQEVQTIYPHRDHVPSDLWRALFGSARREIGILAESALFIADDPRILAAVADRARAGVKVRICLRDPRAPAFSAGSAGLGSEYESAASILHALTRYGSLRECGPAEIRLHQVIQNNSIYIADDDFLISQHAYGIPTGRAPVLYLRRADSGDMVTTYLESFEQVWAGALPAPT
jgi:transcriptional regulator with XRE-family HTH domain